jgi:hypothetical protein
LKGIGEMNEITVDSRRCGEGKTYDNSPTPTYHQGRVLSTWSNIKQRWKLGDRCLVVLPSLALCNAYEQEFTEYIAKHTAPGTTNQLSKITSERTANVQAELHDKLNDRCAIIIITQAAFLQSEIPNAYRQQYHLIIDEAIMPYREIAIWHEQDCLVDFDWANNTSLREPRDGAVEWKELSFHNIKGNFITDTSETTRYLFNDNWLSRCHMDDYAKFAAPIPKNQRMSVIQQLRPEIFHNWITIWIACAAFEHTFMARWMTEHGIVWRIHPKLQFKPHEVPVNIHGPDDLKFTWSRYKLDNEPQLLDQYKQQAANYTKQDGVLVLRNNSNRRQIFHKEQLLPHNSAGSNDYRNYEYVSLESALNITPNLTRFLRDVYGITTSDGLDRAHMAQTVYTFYQTLMRSCLRDGKPATVFCLDNRVILGLGEFFTNINFEELRLVRRADIEEPGRPQSTALGRALTSAERAFIYKKRRYAQYQHMTNEEILALRK